MRGHVRTQLLRRRYEDRVNQPALIDAIERLEDRRLLSGGTLQTVVAFNGANGVGPTAVVEDSSGNLFGVTSDSVVGGQVGPGELFEVKAGANAVTVLATFSNANYAGGSLIIDSAGNLYGTENASANADLPGLVFEMASGSSTITTLATMPGFQGTLGSTKGDANLYLSR